MVGISIEAAMYRKYGGVTKEYKAKYRTVSFNFKDSRNPDLRRYVQAILLFTIAVWFLCVW
jgi:transcription elongation factor S-II